MFRRAERRLEGKSIAVETRTSTINRFNLSNRYKKGHKEALFVDHLSTIGFNCILISGGRYGDLENCRSGE